MPKTGGTWVRHTAISLFGRSAFRVRRSPKQPFSLPEHAPASDVLPTLEGVDGVSELVVVGTLRDPWSWYASWYLHTVQHSPHLYREVRTPSFRDALKSFTKQNLYTSEVNHYYGHDCSDVDYIVDTAQLAKGMADLMGMELQQYPPENVGRYELVNATEPSDMYDSEMIRWVYESDTQLIQTLQMQPFQSFGEAVFSIPRRGEEW